MMKESTYFQESYEQSRALFRTRIDDLRAKWDRVALYKWFIGVPQDDNTADVLLADASESPETLLIITSGLHGIEGYAGAAGLHLFIDELFPYVDPKVTGIRLVHGVNPWGMRHRRRVTARNIDLNRNFHKDWAYRRTLMPLLYQRRRDLFTPESPLPPDVRHELAVTYSDSELEEMKNTPPPQHQERFGLYFGGAQMEEASQKLALSFSDWAAGYKRILHLDLHTGGGPQGELQMIFNENETRSLEELELEVAHPWIQKADGSVTLGDATAVLQQYLMRTYPGKRIVSALMEAGTVPENADGLLFCSRAMIEEHALSISSDYVSTSSQDIREHFRALFDPKDTAWRREYLRQLYKAYLALFSSEHILK
ncbi:M14 family metallopeptidase [Bacillus daqingensis]|uniref:M14 family metallopeptidase n=2 Tax=Bacillus daqingensis TaxID=872396 RepID=A0ABV9NVS6_9BACI